MYPSASSTSTAAVAGEVPSEELKESGHRTTVRSLSASGGTVGLSLLFAVPLFAVPLFAVPLFAVPLCATSSNAATGGVLLVPLAQRRVGEADERAVRVEAAHLRDELVEALGGHRLVDERGHHRNLVCHVA